MDTGMMEYIPAKPKITYLISYKLKFYKMMPSCLHFISCLLIFVTYVKPTSRVIRNLIIVVYFESANTS